MSYQEKFISSHDDLRLYARDYRPYPKRLSKKPVLCLPGLTRNSKDFDEVAKALYEAGHRVVCVDYRGRGKSDYDDEWSNYDPKVYLGDIINQATALGIHNACVIGTSLGGLLAMGLCTFAPGLVSCLVINDVGPDLDATAVDQIIKYTGDASPVETIEDAVKRLKTYYPTEQGFDEDFWRRIASNTYKIKDGRYIPDWDTKIADNLDSSRDNDPVDLWALFKSIAQRRVLLVRGETSEVFTQATYEKMLQCLPNITGHIVKGIGHAPTLEDEHSQKMIFDLVG